MASFLDQLTNGGSSGDGRNPYQREGKLSPTVQAAQAGANQAVEFQMWVSQQATSLAKLKIFSTMAKNINDQQ